MFIGLELNILHSNECIVRIKKSRRRRLSFISNVHCKAIVWIVKMVPVWWPLFVIFKSLIHPPQYSKDVVCVC